MDDHQFKEEEIGSVGELSIVCSQIVLTCLFLARIGRPDILGSVNKLARAITKWASACDKRLARLISYIHHTHVFKQFFHVWNTAQKCRLGISQDSDFAGDSEDSKSTSGGLLCIFGSHTFVPISKKQTSVAHSSTEAEVISLDAGLRMDGVPALDHWNLVIEVFHSSQDQSNKTKGLSAQVNLLLHTTSSKHTRNQTKMFNQARPFWFVSHWQLVFVKISESIAMLYVFEDNESVIMMIIKGRSPTMRHVWRTHRVALDCLFVWQDEPGTQDSPTSDCRHIDKREFHTWWVLLHLFNISHSSSLCCAKNFSLFSYTNTMAKRMQERKDLDKFFICEQSDCVEKPGDTQSIYSGQIGSSGRLGVRLKRNSNPDAASSSQGWQRDAPLDFCTGGPVADR